ncbi:MAG: oxidoreductase, partial [bacterium]
RGSHLVADEKNGIQPHPKLGSEWNFLRESTDLRSEILEVYWDADRKEFKTATTPIRPIPEEQYWFENTWEDYRSGRIFK